MEPAYWGCPPPMHPHFSPWCFNPWAPYPMGPSSYFKSRWDQPSTMGSGQTYEKRTRFDEINMRRVTVDSEVNNTAPSSVTRKGGSVGVIISPLIKEKSSHTLYDQFS